MRGSWFHTDCANHEDSAVSLAVLAVAAVAAVATATATTTAALRRAQIALGVVS